MYAALTIAAHRPGTPRQWGRWGSRHPQLARALDTADDVVREGILRYLQLLSERNYGKEQEEWVEWAARLQ